LQDSPIVGGRTDDLAIAVTLESDVRECFSDEPIPIRLVLRSSGDMDVVRPFRNNREFRAARFEIVIRRNGEVVTHRTFRDSCAKAIPTDTLRPGAELRSEALVMPAILRTSDTSQAAAVPNPRLRGQEAAREPAPTAKDRAYEPLPPGDYLLIARVPWTHESLESGALSIRILPPADAESNSVIDRALIEFVEATQVGAVPQSAATVLKQMPHSKLAAVVTERRLIDRWRQFKERGDASAAELRRASDELQRDLTTHLRQPGFSDVSGELLYTLAAISVRQAELALNAMRAHGKNPKRDAMDAASRAAWRAAWDDAAAAVDRLQKERPESSFNEDASELLTRQIQAIRNTLEKYPDSPNAAELRAALAVLQRVLPQDSP
ncbi:MAG: hypothetical protein ACRD2A_08820, partial [Vicinamibacterales bacterium]